MKEQSPVGRIWELGEREHGKLITAVILAVVGVACGMAPYFAAAKILVLLLAGETAFSAYLPWLLTALGASSSARRYITAPLASPTKPPLTF